MADNGRLTAKQRRAIAALMTSRTIAQAAEKAGIGERTLRRWLAENADFKRAVAAAEEQAIGSAVRQLTVLQESAVAVLVQCLSTDVAPSVRLRAATAILDYCIRLREFHSLEKRIQDLEGLFSEQLK